MKKLQERQPNRLQNYDYSQPGYYYVTICTHNRIELFGEITNNKMVLNNIGNIIDITWKELSQKYPEINIDNYIVMPNHLHGIISMTCRGRVSRPVNNDMSQFSDCMETGAETTPLRVHNPSIGQIIAFYKYKTTKLINKLTKSSGKTIWQRSFYDHIIRKEESLNNIRQYILNNPSTWEDDKENINKV